ncbi:MAG: Calx-beta domain-containing protein [Planctomycetaceae bacterium]
MLQGNGIGTDSQRQNPIPNGRHGVWLLDGTHDNLIGGLSSSVGNTIAFNLRGGIKLDKLDDTFENHTLPGANNSILSNSIYLNVAAGIDLGNHGADQNDANDSDNGPNDLQNYPTITSAVKSSSSVQISGQLSSTPNSQFILELFSSTGAASIGDGQALVHQSVITTNSAGVYNFSVATTASIAYGDHITATATELSGTTTGSTSEFSPPIVVTAASGAPLIRIKDRAIMEGNSATSVLGFEVSLSSPAAGTVTVDFARVGGTAAVGSDFSIPTSRITFAPGETSKFAEVLVVGDQVDESDETISVRLSNASGGIIVQADAVGTIFDNDSPFSRPIGADWSDLSQYMLGTVYVPVIVLDSDDSVDAELERWSPSQADAIKAIVNEGLQWWVDALAKITDKHELRFIPDFRFVDNPVQISVEPLSRPATAANVDTYLSDFLDFVSADTADNYANDLRHFLDARRLEVGTDWVFPLFYQLSANDFDQDYADARGFYNFARAELYEINRNTTNAFTVVHETGHIFYAMDEYGLVSGRVTGAEYTARSGYYNIQNLNATNGHPSPSSRVPSVMSNGAELTDAFDDHLSSPSSLAMIGWQDSDNDGIFDVLDVPSLLTATEAFDPATGKLAITGQATVGILPNNNPWSSNSGNDISIGRIRTLQYRVNSGAWQQAAQYDASTVDIATSVDASAGDVVEFRTLTNGPQVASNIVSFVVPVTQQSVSVSATNASKSEGDSGATPFTFTVTRSGNVSSTASVNYAVTGSSASPANAADFEGTLPSGKITFAANETSKVITINVSGDTQVEPDERFTVSLSNASSGTIISAASATGTIQNDDISIAGFTAIPTGGSTTVTEAGTSDTVVVVLTSRPASNVVLNVTSGNPGEVIVDQATLIFTPSSWDIPQTVTVTGVNDTPAVVDGDQITEIVLSVDVGRSDSAFANVTGRSVSVTTIDDDIATVTILLSGHSISENGGTTTATVTRNTPANQPLTVMLSSSDPEEATLPGFVTIPVGQTTSPTFTISGVDDQIVDGAQTVNITATATGHAGSAASVEVTDDDTELLFAITAPVGKVQTVRPLVSWTAVPTAVSYDLWVNLDGGGGNVFQQRGIGGDQTSLMLPQDLEFGRYRIFLYANMPGGGRETATGHTFVLDVQPQLTPIGATLTTRAEFTWNRIPGADSYILFVNVPGGPARVIVADPGNGSSVTHSLATALPRNDYKWWVRPVRSNGWPGPWSEASEFSTGGRTKATSPARGTTVASSLPVFQWPAVSGAQSYEVYVSKTGTPGVLYRDSGIPGNSIRSRPLQNGDYKVWIRTTLADGSSVWGSGVPFSVSESALPLQSTPLTPDRPGFDGSPTFNWVPTNDAESYDLLLHSGNTSTLLPGQTGSSFTPLQALSASTWTWYVRPVNSSGIGEWSNGLVFNTDGRAIVLNPGTVTSDRTPTFGWSPVSQASGYVLQVDNRSTNTSNTIREDQLTNTEFTPATPLTPGNYRAWVRAISGQTAGPWSVQLDFTVVAADAPARSVTEPIEELTQALSALANGALEDVVTEEVIADSRQKRLPEFKLPDSGDSLLSQPTETPVTSVAAEDQWLSALDARFCDVASVLDRI